MWVFLGARVEVTKRRGDNKIGRRALVERHTKMHGVGERYKRGNDGVILWEYGHG